MNKDRRQRVERVGKAIGVIFDEKQFSDDNDLSKYVIEDYTGNSNLDRSILEDKHTRKLYVAMSDSVQDIITLEALSKIRLDGAPVLVDMDNVLVDYEETTRRMILEAYPEMKLRPADEAAYVGDLTISPEDRQRALDIQYAKGHFLNMPPIPGALEGWQRIQELGYHPQIGSSPLTRNFWCIQEKLSWLDHYLGPSVVDQARISPDKFKLNGIALIDDMPTVKNSELAVWSHIVFDQPYNKISPAEFRLQGWDDLALSAHLARCALKYAQH